MSYNDNKIVVLLILINIFVVNKDIMEQKYLTVSQVIEQLLKLDQNAIFTINIKQHNKVYGKQVRVLDSPTHYGTQNWINSSYGGCAVTVHLPQKAIISKWPED